MDIRGEAISFRYEDANGQLFRIVEVISRGFHARVFIFQKQSPGSIRQLWDIAARPGDLAWETAHNLSQSKAKGLASPIKPDPYSTLLSLSCPLASQIYQSPPRFSLPFGIYILVREAFNIYNELESGLSNQLDNSLTNVRPVWRLSKEPENSLVK